MNIIELIQMLVSMFTNKGTTVPVNPVVDNTMHLKVERLTKTIDGIFGKLYINGVYECDTVESLVHALPANTYSLNLYNSPDHGCICPLMDTSTIGRTYCEIHICNLPSQLLGCIGLGTSVDGDAVDYSGVAFNAFMAKFKLPSSISITENYTA